ncbi:hypothetical protein GCM10023191_021490 [Actinoallomurus oryzae]|jgi:hypothetical protein|uniref:Peptidase inhibitor family I36 n=1 Tax=Actinoallomurus oryzae TaxID=502180 RepID=A0ABP8PRL1_9ACTN
MKLVTMLTAAATAAVATTGLAAENAEASGIQYKACPSGYVCIYEYDYTFVSKYYTYGSHNLSYMYGLHRIKNSQTGGAKVTLCYGYNGTDCTGPTIPAGKMYEENLTPINSIYLYP